MKFRGESLTNDIKILDFFVASILDSIRVNLKIVILTPSFNFFSRIKGHNYDFNQDFHCGEDFARVTVSHFRGQPIKIRLQLPEMLFSKAESAISGVAMSLNTSSMHANCSIHRITNEAETICQQLALFQA